MARPTAPGIRRDKFVVQPKEPSQRIYLEEARVNGGMSTFVDPVDLPLQVLSLAKNARVRSDKIRRRPGSVMDIEAANGETIYQYVQFKRFDKITYYIRFSATEIHYSTGTSWTEITGTGYSATLSDRVRFALLNDRLFFSSNDVIQEIDLSEPDYADLGNAPRFKYMCGFFNRLVGAYLQGSTDNPVLIGWSGDLNFSEWNPSTAISAGSNPLVEASGDFSDPITGLFGFAAVMLILRERSLWFATKRPVASAPFSFTAAFPYVGCDAPNSATQRQDGITWYDRRTNQVYDFTLGQRPEPIGDAIRNELERLVTDPNLVQGTYDPGRNRFFLTVLSENSEEANTFVFDYRTGSWVWDVRSGITGAYAFDATNIPLMIDDLIGTIDDLVGDIDDLTADSAIPAAIYYTGSDGNVWRESEGTDRDFFDPEDITSGIPFSMELNSKLFANQQNDWSVQRLLFKMQPLRNGVINVFYSTDGSDWRMYSKVISASGTDRLLVKFPKHIYTTEYQWRLVQTTGTTEILEYRLEGTVGGESRSM